MSSAERGSSDGVTAAHYKGMKKPLAPLRRIAREYLDDRGVWMHLLECGHEVTAHPDQRPFARRCVFCRTLEHQHQPTEER